jgi:hypothetical protein
MIEDSWGWAARRPSAGGRGQSFAIWGIGPSFQAAFGLRHEVIWPARWSQGIMLFGIAPSTPDMSAPSGS